jgi:hypothetical protein
VSLPRLGDEVELYPDDLSGLNTPILRQGVVKIALWEYSSASGLAKYERDACRLMADRQFPWEAKDAVSVSFSNR